ncbi:uncharacterized protein LOC120734850 isoform X2 [Simochromis diagramma]|nr:uncharacterized protein LOC120734850 isoform X2 [Simochromis diagramma]
MQIFEGSKGAKGQKIKDIMAISSLCDDIDIKREHTLKSLVIYFNEDPDLLFKEYLTSSTEDERLRSTAATVMGIYTIRREGIQEPEDVAVVIEGTTVMNNLGSVIMAFIVLFGLIHALDLSYPNDLKYTFELCQKNLMNLDGQRLSTNATNEIEDVCLGKQDPSTKFDFGLFISFVQTVTFFSPLFFEK